MTLTPEERYKWPSTTVTLIPPVATAKERKGGTQYKAAINTRMAAPSRNKLSGRIQSTQRPDPIIGFQKTKAEAKIAQSPATFSSSNGFLSCQTTLPESKSTTKSLISEKTGIRMPSRSF